MMIDSNIIDTEKALDEIYGDDLDAEEKARILANTGQVSFADEEVDLDE